jgi:hypothetical protein
MGAISGSLKRFVNLKGLMGALLIAGLVFPSPAVHATRAHAATPAPIVNLLPAPGFSEGWITEGKRETFAPENLYQHINGEAELFIPYGFESLAFSLYANAKDLNTALAVDIYRMRSPLDAYGIYSNYRNPDAEAVKVGSEGFIGDTQLMFYQDRYFVEITASGTATPDRKVFMAAAQAIAGKLPSPAVKPKEIILLNAPQVAVRTEKYVAESVLGYAFFKRGLTAEASVDGKTAKAFVILNDSPADARLAIDGYVAYLKKAGVEPKMTEEKGAVTILARDPLYKALALRQSGIHLFGVINSEAPEKGLALLEVLTAKK